MTTATQPAALAHWHRLVRERDAAGLSALLDHNVVFHSPVVHAPQRGKALVTGYLAAALAVLGGESFRYVREVVGRDDAALEFTTTIGDVSINGVDLLRWNAAGRIVDFKVMIRPLKAIQAVHEAMARALERRA
jgi:hypothetical protein